MWMSKLSFFALSQVNVVLSLFHCRIVMGNVNQQDNEGMTPLHCASHFCRPRHIVLLNEGTDCDQYIP